MERDAEDAALEGRRTQAGLISGPTFMKTSMATHFMLWPAVYFTYTLSGSLPSLTLKLLSCVLVPVRLSCTRFRGSGSHAQGLRFRLSCASPAVVVQRLPAMHCHTEEADGEWSCICASSSDGVRDGATGTADILHDGHADTAFLQHGEFAAVLSTWLPFMDWSVLWLHHSRTSTCHLTCFGVMPCADADTVHVYEHPRLPAESCHLKPSMRAAGNAGMLHSVSLVFAASSRAHLPAAILTAGGS